MSKLQLLLSILLLTLTVLTPFSEFLAQCSGPHDPELLCCFTNSAACGGPSCPECVEIPFDGGLTALLLAGLAYGYKKIHKS